MNQIGKQGQFPGDCPMCGEALEYVRSGVRTVENSVQHEDGKLDHFISHYTATVWHCPECGQDWQNRPSTDIELNLALPDTEEK